MMKGAVKTVLRRRVSEISLAALLVAMACSADPHGYVFPGDSQQLVEDSRLLEAIADLPEGEQKRLARAYLARHPTGSQVPPGTTLGDAIDVQRQEEERERARQVELEAESQRQMEEALRHAEDEKARQAARDEALGMTLAGWRHAERRRAGSGVTMPLLEQRYKEQEEVARLLEGGTKKLWRVDARTKQVVRFTDGEQL